VTWSVSPALPGGATFSTSTGVISWMPGCGTAGNYGPFTLTATATTGEVGNSNAFAILVTHKAGTVTVAAIGDPQTVQEQSTLTITPSAALGVCAAGPVTWSVSPALPAGATFSTSTGVISWTPACGDARNYGPFTLTATAASAEFGTSNSFAIVVTHKTGTVTVAAISTPQTVQESDPLTITPAAALTACAAGPMTWSVSPSLPSGATFSTSTGMISWTPPCGSVGNYGPFTLTATATTGEAGSSNAFTIVVTHKTGTVTVAAISSPQTVQETDVLTITPSAALGACAAGPVTWSVSPPLPGGATFSATTGVIIWTPGCATAGNYGPFTLTATATTGEFGSSNAFTIVVTHKAGTVTVAAISDPQTVQEQSSLTITPSATLGACAAAPLTWSLSPGLPPGATFSATAGQITWTPSCGDAGTYGPFTLTATAATGEVGSSNSFSIVVTHKPGTVMVGAITDPQTVAELATLTIGPIATTSPCVVASSLVWSVSPALPAGASLNPSTGQITWTPDCHAAEGGVSGTYGPFTLTATAGTGETGSSNAFSIHVTDTPSATGAPTSASATQVLTGNPSGGITGITIHFTPPSGAVAFKVYRAPYGNYPEYDAGGAAPAQPISWPPGAPWQLTTVTADGGSDLPPTRDYWYYVVYAQSACGDMSVASTMTSGTLDYHLGDVSDGATAGSGDNLVDNRDISLLGFHYGLSGAAVLPYNYLDVGPTTTSGVDGRPVTDDLINFEDLIIFAINYSQVSGPPASSRPARAVSGSDAVVLERPEQVTPGAAIVTRLLMQGSGAVRGLSIKLAWDPAVVKPVSHAPGDWLTSQNGVAFSAQPGMVDCAVMQAAGMTGDGLLATVTFQVVAAGDPGIRIEKVDGRDQRNQGVPVGISERGEIPSVTELAPVMPNPVRSSATLSFSLARGGSVELAIFSVDGRRVRTLARDTRQPGAYALTWDGRDDSGNLVAAGAYYAHLVAPQGRFTRKLVYLR
jgi:hypothetical protein